MEKIMKFVAKTRKNGDSLAISLPKPLNLKLNQSYQFSVIVEVNDEK